MLNKVKTALAKWLLSDLNIQITVLHKRMIEHDDSIQFALEQILNHDKKIGEVQEALNDMFFIVEDEEAGKE